MSKNTGNMTGLTFDRKMIQLQVKLIITEIVIN